MPSHPTLSRSTLAAALVVAFAALGAPSSPVGAAGLGRLSVQSHLGQPLRAEVEVTSLSVQESQTLSARLAPPEAFQLAGLQYNATLAGVRLAIEPRAGRTYLRLSSPQPINEPFVDLLIELSWAGGKLLREYTFLLDPPPEATRPGTAGSAGSAGLASADSNAAANPAAAAPPPPAADPSRPSPGASRQAPAASASPSASASSASASGGASARAPAASGVVSGSIEVVRGETLGAIAQRVRPVEASLDQAMWAIFSANPAAFGGNMNMLRAGATLAIPDAASMSAVPVEEARRQVRMQTADFSSYRRQLAAVAPQAGVAAGGSASGSVAGRVEDGAPSAGNADRLRLSRPEAGTPASGPAVGRSGAGNAPNGSTEQLVAKDAALREAQSRLESLEKNVDDLKRLLELRNRAMVDLQSQLEEARAAVKTASGNVAGSAPPPLPAPASEGSPAAGASTSEPPAAQAAAPASPASPPAAPTVEPASEAPKAAPVAPTSPSSAAASAPNFLDELLENPLLLPALGTVAALGGGYALYAIRRRRRVERFEDSLIAADALAPNSLFGATGGQNVDTRQVDDPIDGLSITTQTTEVDPVEEANVYVAYGREAQAEDILREGLKRDPHRQAIRHRLLELYAARPDRLAFEAVAREMQSMTAGAGADWERAALLGQSIDPDNALYASARASEGAGHPDSAALPQASDSEQDSLSVTAFSPVVQPEPVVAPSDDLEFKLDPPTVTQVSAQPQEGPGDRMEPIALDLPALDLNLEPESDSSVLTDPTDVVAERRDTGGSEALRARVPNLPDALDLDLDLAALEEISRIQMPSGLPRAAASPADLGLDLELEGALNTPTDIMFPPTTTEASSWQEMATKLDLAVAYHEIGDDEGARELLQEVIAGGDADQQDKARKLLAELA